MNVASLQASSPDVLWADGCHPVLLRAGRSLDDARLVGPAVEYWRDLSARCDTKLMPGHPDALVVAAHLAAAYLAAGYATRPCTGTSGCWPNAAASSRPGTRPSSRPGSTWPRP